MYLLWAVLNMPAPEGQALNLGNSSCWARKRGTWENFLHGLSSTDEIYLFTCEYYWEKFSFAIITISKMYKSPVLIGVKFLNHSIIDVHENISDSLLFSSKQNGSGLKLTLILVRVSRCMEIMNVLFDLFVKCYLPAWFVLLRSRVHSRVCAAVWVLFQEPLFWKSLGKGSLWSAKQCQGHELLTGIRTSSSAVNTKKPLCEELPVASHFWQCSFKCWMRC